MKGSGSEGSHRVVIPINMSHKSLETSTRHHNPPIDVQSGDNEYTVEAVCFFVGVFHHDRAFLRTKQADVGVLVNLKAHRPKDLLVGCGVGGGGSCGTFILW